MTEKGRSCGPFFAFTAIESGVESFSYTGKLGYANNDNKETFRSIRFEA
jgi:hypothetical protein